MRKWRKNTGTPGILLMYILFKWSLAARKKFVSEIPYSWRENSNGTTLLVRAVRAEKECMKINHSNTKYTQFFTQISRLVSF